MTLGAPSADSRTPNGELAIGLDVGATKIVGGLFEGDSGRILAQMRVATPTSNGAAGILATMVEIVAKLRGLPADGPSSPSSLVGIGISSAGHVDWEAGRIVDGTPNLRGWSGTEVAKSLSDLIGLPACCDNDGNAAAWGEARWGRGKGRKAIVAITLGTGFGAGIYDRGALLRGACGGGAELGHIILHPEGRSCNCGQFGCVEAYVSGTALGHAATALWGPTATTRDVFERSRAGDAAAQMILADFSRHLALVAVTIFNMADPELLLIGGGLAHQADLFLPGTRLYFEGYRRGRRWQADQIQLASLGDLAGMIGAASQALERFGNVSHGPSTRESELNRVASE